MIRRHNALAGLVLLFLVLLAGIQVLRLWLDRPIERVSVRGDWQYMSAEYLRSELAPNINDMTWLTVDLERLRDQAIAVGWIDEVSVSREWPDALVFNIREQGPSAFWNEGRVLNDRGVVFTPGGIAPPATLPQLAGPQGSGEKVMGYFQELSRRLEPSGMSIRELRLESRGAWRMRLDSGAWVLLGTHQHDERISRLLAAWKGRLAVQGKEIESVDLRYPNGIAVSWRGESS